MSISDYGQREKHHHTVMSGTVKKRPDSTPGRFLDNSVQITEYREQRKVLVACLFCVAYILSSRGHGIT